MKSNCEHIINQLISTNVVSINNELYAEYFKRKQTHVKEKDIKNLSKQDVFNIIKKKYWDPCGCDALIAPLDKLFFYLAISTSIGFAIKTLQKYLSITPTGIVDNTTINKLGSLTVEDINKWSLVQLKDYYLPKLQEALPDL